MTRFLILLACIGSWLFCRSGMRAQEVPTSSSKPWVPPSGKSVSPALLTQPSDKYSLSANQTYTLSELIDLAEAHNPETRASWEGAKQQAAALKVARSELFPTLAAVAMGANFSEWRPALQPVRFATAGYRFRRVHPELHFA